MHKLIATLTNHLSPLEQSTAEDKKILEMYVDNPRDSEEILSKLQSEVIKIREKSDATLGLKVVTESGEKVLEGQITDEFYGILMK